MGVETIDEVPRLVLHLSRALSIGMAALYLNLVPSPLGAQSARIAGFLVLTLAVTCFPNQMAALAHLAPGSGMSGPSSPRLALLLGWILLLVPAGFALARALVR